MKPSLLSLPLLLSAMFLFIVAPFAQQSAHKGDLTQDGAIDGRDALKLLRSIQGLEALPDTLHDLGDVYPFRKESATLGDGQLTQEDAEKILRYAVGLVPSAEMGMQGGSEAPAIDSFAPRHGEIGAEVVIHGENFFSSAPINNQVFFGERAAEIVEMSATRIKTVVPAGAITSRVRVKTPAGEGESIGEYIVTNSAAGQLHLDGGLNLANFKIVTPYKEITDVPADGSFTLPVADHRPTLVGAVPKSGGAHIYLSLWQAEDSERVSNGAAQVVSDQPREINAYTTAKALVFLSPFFTTKNNYAVAYLDRLMDEVAEVGALGEVIASQYPRQAPGLDDPAVEAAWIDAVVAVNAAMPDTLSVDPSDPQTTAKVATRPQWLPSRSLIPFAARDWLGLHRVRPNRTTTRGEIRLMGADMHFTDATIHKNGIEPSVENYSPLDWFVTLYRVAPLREDFPLGLNEPIGSLAVRPLQPMGNSRSTYLPATQWTAKIDVSYTIVDYAINSIVDTLLPEDKAFPLAEEDAVYLLRAYSGAVNTYDDRDEVEYEILNHAPNGKRDHRVATAMNLVLAGIDLWDLVTPESKQSYKNAVNKALQNAMRKLTQELAGQSLQDLSTAEWTRILFNVYVEIRKATMNVAIGDAASDGMERMCRLFGQAGTKITGVLGLLDKISTAGRVGERVLGLAGHTSTVLHNHKGPSPIESSVIVKGDPFRASIESIQPTHGGRGTVITITGTGFSPTLEENFVELQPFGLPGRHAANVLKFVDYGAYGELQVECPALTDMERYNIYLYTTQSITESRAEDQFTYYRVPVVRKIQPESGFAPITDPENPINIREGSLFTLQGEDFFPAGNTTILFGETEIPLSGQGTHPERLDRYQAHVPDVPPGLYNVFLRTEKDGKVIDGKEFPFRVMDKPVIQSVEPAVLQKGTVAVVTGTHFGQERDRVSVEVNGEGAVVYDLDDNGITFLVPVNTEIKETNNTIHVWNPTGRSNGLEVQMNPGMADRPSITERNGWTIQVDTNVSSTKDGKISFDEACAFASGREDPFTTKWDDQGTWHKYYYTGRYDENGNPINLTLVKTTSEKLPITSGYEYNRWSYYMDNLDNDSSHYAGIGGRTEPLDENPGDWEEGDVILTHNGNQSDELKDQGGTGLSDRIVSSLPLVEASTPVFRGSDKIELSPNTLLKTAVSLQLSSGAQIWGGTVECSGQPGILLDNTLSNTIECSLQNCPTGIHIKNAAHGTVSVVMQNCANGIVMDNAQYNTVKATITDCENDGIAVNGGGMNKIRLADASRITNHGIYLNDSHYNQEIQISGKGISNALTLEKSNANRIMEINIEGDGAANGLTLNDSHYNVFKYLTIRDYQGEGLSLNNSRHNVFSGIYKFFNNHGIGIHLTNNSDNNFFKGIHAHGNAGGIRIDSGCDTNYFSQSDIGRSYDAPPTENINSGHGIVMRGSNNNTFETCRIGGNGLSGFVMEGGDTTRFIDCEFFDNRGPDNTGHGIHISQGASRVRFEDCVFGKAFINVDQQPDGETQKIVTSYPNHGWGALIEGPATDVTFVDSVFAANSLGGLYGKDIAAKQDGSPNLIVERCTFGYNKPIHETSTARDHALSQIESVTGEAIHLDNVQNAVVDWIYSSGHQSGLYLTDSAHCTFRQFHVRNALYGIHLENSEHNTFPESSTFKNIVANLFVKDSRFNHFLRGGSSFSDGDGIVVSGGAQNRFEAMEVRENLIHGVLVNGGTNHLFTKCNVRQSQSDGIVVHGGSGHVFDRTRSEESATGSGYVLAEDARGVTLVGGNQWSEGAVYNNALHGIVIDNAHEIRVGRNGKGIDISGYAEDGIHITGERTSGIHVASTRFLGNGQNGTSENGIFIDDGNTIKIGGEDDIATNDLEYHHTHGIHVRGEKPKNVIIQNNRIGEPEQWETGTRENGHEYGVFLDGASNVLVKGNLFNNNQNDGVHVTGEAVDNRIVDNQFFENGGHGVLVKGSAARNHVISKNTFRENGGAPIKLTDGGNRGIEPPSVTALTWDSYNIRGHCSAPDGSFIEIYSGSQSKGWTMENRTTLYNHGFMSFAYIPLRGEARAIVIDPSGNTSEFGPTVSLDPQNGANTMPIAYTTTDRGNEDIALLQTEGAVPKYLTTHAAADFDPVFFHQGEGLAFVSKRNGSSDIFTMSNQSGDPQTLVAEPGEDLDPAWSETAGKWLFASDMDGDFDIYAMNSSAGSGGRGEIYYYSDAGEPEAGRPNSPPGSESAILFTVPPGTRVDGLAFSLVDLTTHFPSQFGWKIRGFDGEPTNEIFLQGEATAERPRWNEIEFAEPLDVPEQFLVSFVTLEDKKPLIQEKRQGEGEPGFMYITSIDDWIQSSNSYYMMKVFTAGSGVETPQRLTNSEADERYPTWSPDGSQIAYASNREGSYDLWLAAADGNNPQRLTDETGDALQPVWSPGGKSIVYTIQHDGDSEIYSVDVITKERTPITSGSDPAWHKDGQRIVYAGGGPGAREIYMTAMSAAEGRRLTVSLGEAYLPAVSPINQPLSGGQAAKIVAARTHHAEPMALPAEMQLTLGRVTVKPGELAELAMQIDGAEEVGNLQFDLHYDSNTVQLMDVNLTTNDFMTMHAMAPAFKPSYRTPLRFNGIHATGYHGSAPFLSFQFAVDAWAREIQVPLRLENVKAYTANELIEIPVSIENGAINVIPNDVAVKGWMLY
ncbi:hypothetical protein GF373_07515 [bacterium]|nr:hypothetical protein [bacterium]